MTEEPSSRRRAQELWDAQSRWNALVAIYSSADVRDPERADEAFWRAGAADARRLAWFFAPGARVLDLGCGVGRVLRFLAARAGEAIGVDISREMLARAEQASAGVPNVRFLQTSGASLEGVASRSIDFLYSLLCLIHVDRRSAYRYLEETRRVLRPNGLAFLQFQNIASEAGLAKFRSVLDLDYPLEFYTLEELRYLLASTGLEVVTWFEEAEYFYVTVIAGDAAAWRAGIATGLRSEAVELDPAGALRVTLRSALPAVQPLRFELSVTRAGRPLRVAEAILDLPPGTSRLEAAAGGPEAGPRARLDGRSVELHPALETPWDAAGGPVEYHAALLPPGFLHTPDFQATFASLACSWRSP